MWPFNTEWGHAVCTPGVEGAGFRSDAAAAAASTTKGRGAHLPSGLAGGEKTLVSSDLWNWLMENAQFISIFVETGLIS